MQCPSCSAEMAASTSFCPACGEPGTPTGDAADTQLGAATGGAPAPSASATTTTVLAPVSVSPVDDVRERLGDATRTVRQAPRSLQLAGGGAVLLVLGFLLPYDSRGSAMAIGGRAWARPLLALVVTGLVAVATGVWGQTASAARSRDAALSALALAGLLVGETGLVSLLAGGARDPRIGFYLMLVGALTLLAGAWQTARHRC